MNINQEFSCFHITTEDRLESILESGLKPNSPRNRGTRRNHYILLSLYPNWTLYKNFKKNQKQVLIEIRHPEITRDMFLDDPEGLAWDKVIVPKFFRAIVRIEVIK